MKESMENSLEHIEGLVRRFYKSDLDYVLMIMLIELGIPKHVEGFHYLITAILNYSDNMICLVNTKLYGIVVAQSKRKISTIIVERAIHRAIAAGWKNRKGKMWEYYFPGIDMDSEKAPTNHQFISMMALVLELWKGLRQTYEYELAMLEERNGTE